MPGFNAAEPLTRNAMSKPLRESLDALVDDTYENLVTTIAAVSSVTRCRPAMSCCGWGRRL